MKTHYVLFRIALLVVIGGAFCFVRATTGQVRICEGRAACTFNGFSQSMGDPNVRGPAQLIVNSQVDNDWTGLFTLYGTTYSVTGKVDANGNLKFTSGRAGEIKGDGKWQDLTRGGALIFGSYKLGSGDQGKVNFLLNFTQPPDPGPPDIAGSHSGTFQDILSLMMGTSELVIQQDRTPTGAPSTGFMGQETIDTSVKDFVGTIDGGGNFVRIGVSAQGLLIGGGKVESGQLTDTTVESHAGPGQNNDVKISYNVRQID